jgi:hypothetical protein
MNENGIQYNTSCPERDYSEFLRFSYKNRFITNYSHDQNPLMQYKKICCPDIYDKVSNTAIFFNSCSYYHEHPDQFCTNVKNVQTM